MNLSPHRHRPTTASWPHRLTLALAALCVCGCIGRKPVSPAVGLDSPEASWVRVLLFGNRKSGVLQTENGFIAEGAVSGATLTFAAGGQVDLSVADGQIVIGGHRLCADVLIKPFEPVYFIFDGAAFRGYLRLIATADGLSFDAVNHLPIESYLLGVVGAEMHSWWQPEALKAQAVVARTYALAIKYRFGAGRPWDMTRTQANQVYEGIAAENARVRRAVLETTGQALVGQLPDGGLRLFAAYYSSSCGGHTEDSGNVFGYDDGFVVGVNCSWCRDVARRKDFSWGPVVFTIAEVNEKLLSRYPSLARLERIVSVEATRTGYLGRIVQVQLTGANGQKDTLRGEDFRLALDPTGRRLKSALAQMRQADGKLIFENGQGFGHGVGLCQCGAEGLARQGLDYRAILTWYFPNSRLVRIDTVSAP